jgi:mannosyltransferase OCH1-like enzyme
MYPDHELLLTGRGALPFRFDPPRERNLEIPRKLHVVWIGSEIPDKYRKNVEDFAVHNPGWYVEVWLDHFETPIVGAFRKRASGVVSGMRNRDLYDAEPNVAAKVDLLRYEIVHRHGGVYLDADTLSLCPGSLDRMTHAFLTVSGEPWCNTGNAQFGFAAGSEFLAYVIENARDERVRRQTCITKRTGPTFLTTCALSFNDFRIIHPDGAWLLEKVRHTADKNW